MLLAMLLCESANLRVRFGTSNLFGAFSAAFGLALLRRPVLTPLLRWSAGYFWAAAAASILLALVLGYFRIEAPRRFDLEGLESEGFYLLLTLCVSYLIARAFANPRLLWPVATMITAAGLVVATVMHLVYYEVLPRWELAHRYWFWAAYGLSLLWWLAILMRMFAGLGLRAPVLERMRIAAAAIGLTSLVSWYVRPIDFWETDYAAQYLEGEELAPLVAEEIFGDQKQLLDRALSQLTPPDPAKPDLYFVSFSPYGSQRVFEREALYARQQFEERFGARGRTLTLITHRDQLSRLPLATATNLEQALRWLGKRMDQENDILFLFLNSHGAQHAELSVELGNLTFRPVTAESLAQMLDDAGIRWRVLLVSACYSGSFIPALQDEHTLLMTAARADRTSFGCSEAADFTYFGRAYFEQALNQTDSFTEAFALAKASVAEQEKSAKYEHSEPQMVSSPAIEEKLAQWRKQRTGVRVTSP